MTPEAATREAALRWISEGRRFVAAVLVEVLAETIPLQAGRSGGRLADAAGPIRRSAELSVT